MPALSSKQLHLLATRPSAYAKFIQTGRAPQGIKPSSPLVTLLRAVGPRDLTRMVGMTVDQRLGYVGSRRFHNAAQALNWVAPAAEVFGSFPAESCRDKRFQGPLFLEDLVACCTSVPQDLLARHRQLCRPVTTKPSA